MRLPCDLWDLGWCSPTDPESKQRSVALLSETGADTETGLEAETEVEAVVGAEAEAGVEAERRQFYSQAMGVASGAEPHNQANASACPSRPSPPPLSSIFCHLPHPDPTSFSECTSLFFRVSSIHRKSISGTQPLG